MEERFEDEQDIQERERARRALGNQISRGRSDKITPQDLIQLAKQHGNLYSIIIDILKRYGQIFQRDIIS